MTYQDDGFNSPRSDLGKTFHKFGRGVRAQELGRISWSWNVIADFLFFFLNCVVSLHFASCFEIYLTYLLSCESIAFKDKLSPYGIYQI